jgi:hypothetical protein
MATAATNLPESETINAIARLGRDSLKAEDKVKIISLPGDDKRFLIVDTDGRYDERQAFTSRKMSIGSVDSIWQLASDYRQQLEAAEDGGKVEICLSASDLKVCAVDNKNVLMMHGGMNFEPSPEITALELLAEMTTDAKTLVRYLISNLKDCYADNVQQLVNVLKNYRSSQTYGNRVQISNSKESLGREIENELISEAGELPEQIRFSLPVFMPFFRDNENDKFTIRCNVFADPQTGQFEIRPMEHDVLFARRAALTSIRDYLISEASEISELTTKIHFYDVT